MTDHEFKKTLKKMLKIKYNPEETKLINVVDDNLYVSIENNPDIYRLICIDLSDRLLPIYIGNDNNEEEYWFSLDNISSIFKINETIDDLIEG